MTYTRKPGAHPAASALGSIKSTKKAASSRKNGKLGGRPRKQASESPGQPAKSKNLTDEREE